MSINKILKMLDLRIRDNVSGVFAPESMNTLRAHIRELEARAEKAERERDKAIKALSEQARLLGEAEGKLAASEMAGVVDGWKARAERAEAENKRLRDALDASLDAALAAMEATDE